MHYRKLSGGSLSYVGWSVGYQLPPESDLIDEILLAVGKALYLANNFESKCKVMLQAANIVDIMEADPVISLEQIVEKLPKPQMLDGTLQALAPHMSQEQSEVLKKARLARNGGGDGLSRPRDL
jgi:hypothetical protein